jgi:hypothetical protein
MMLTGGELPRQFASACCPDRLRVSLLEEIGASTEAQELLRVLLAGTIIGRITAASASKHPWTLGHHSPPAARSASRQKNRRPSLKLVVDFSGDSLCPEKNVSRPLSPLAVCNDVVGIHDQTACGLRNVDNVVVPGHCSDKSDSRPVCARPLDNPSQDPTPMCADEDFAVFVDLPEEHPCSTVPGGVRTEAKQSWKAARGCKENLGPTAFPLVTRSHMPSSERQKVPHAKMGCNDASLTRRRLLLR